MIKIAVCDDEAAIREQMHTYLESLDPVFQIVYLESGEALLTSPISFDIIFLDIDLKGLSGIDTARKLRQKNKTVKIIYITAYEDFRDYAFSVHAFGYLVKPLKKQAILQVLKEALAYAKEEQLGPILRFQTEEGILELPVSGLSYFEYECRKISMHTDKGIYHLRETLSALTERLADMGFASPHKGFLVNLSHIQSIRGYELLLTDGTVLPLSQKRSAQFRQLLTRYLAQQL